MKTWPSVQYYMGMFTAMAACISPGFIGLINARRVSLCLAVGMTEQMILNSGTV